MDAPEKPAYAVPSVSDPMPPCEGTAPTNAVLIRELDWRQMEFVSQAEAQVLAAELEQVSEHSERARKGDGFTDLFIRSEPKNPLGALAVAPGDIFETLAEASLQRRPLELDSKHGSGNMIGGFAFKGKDITLYGCFRDKKTWVLGLVPFDHAPAENERKALLRLAKKYELYLVDWRSCQVYKAEAEQFMPIHS